LKSCWRQPAGASDVDLFEINEAFAMVTMLAMRAHDMDHAKVNVHGGACAQGHPIGSTGSRIMVTLMYALKKTGGRRGVAACASAAAKPWPSPSSCSDRRRKDRNMA
jgi:acetyl-CoA acetyltransferase